MLSVAFSLAELQLLTLSDTIGGKKKWQNSPLVLSGDQNAVKNCIQTFLKKHTLWSVVLQKTGSLEHPFLWRLSLLSLQYKAEDHLMLFLNGSRGRRHEIMSLRAPLVKHKQPSFLFSNHEWKVLQKNCNHLLNTAKEFPKTSELRTDTEVKNNLQNYLYWLKDWELVTGKDAWGRFTLLQIRNTTEWL